MNTLVKILCGTILLTTIAVEARSSRKEAQMGKKAPNFILEDENGESLELAKMVGQKVALVFYPSARSFSIHCKAEVCSIRDGFVALKKAGIQVLGISYDTVAVQKKFKESNDLNFPLLSDSSKEVAGLYGVRGWLAPSRATFLIDEQGVLIARMDDINVRNHADQILEAFQTN
jgi:peroxiredoxin Q/BCP